MSFSLDGFVLRPPKAAPSNATTTGSVNTGVLRDVRDLPASHDLPGELVEFSADQYRAAVLEAPSETSTEYLLWAINTSNLGLLEDPSWSITEGSGSFPTGTLTVGSYTDGTDRVVVMDDGGRSLSDILRVGILRGDTNVLVEAGPSTVNNFFSQDASAGLAVLSSATLTALGGGVSARRGDQVVSVEYVLAGCRFYWTKNDVHTIRFGWNGRTQRWEPFKGSSPVAVGTLLPNTVLQLQPKPTGLVIGEYLAGTQTTSDKYATLRLGTRPDAATSTPIAQPVVSGFGGVLVVSDQVVEDGVYTFTTEAGIVGSDNGHILWNPAFALANAGQQVWYVFEHFIENSTGTLGALKNTDVYPKFLCPVPRETEYPLIRLGFRKHLRAIQVDTDAVLASTVVAEGEVAWSATTGKLKFNAGDVGKADPDSVSFDIRYLNANVYYDGVSLTSVGLSPRAPVQLVDSSGAPALVGSGNLYIPEASLGMSGVFHIPDKTGTPPNTSAVPSTRPNGSGLVRSLSGFGDEFLFSKHGVFERLRITEFKKDLPVFAFKIPKNEAYVALQGDTAGSRVKISASDERTLDGEALYFIQSDVELASYSDKARLYSRSGEPFVLTGTEKLAFSIDGTLYLWDASGLGAGTYSAEDVSADMSALLTNGSITVSRGRIVISSDNLATGSVEIGYGSTTSGAFVDRDLSGAAALGFLPGWRIDSSHPWLSESGVVFGLSRSPQNLARATATPDYKAFARFNNVPLVEEAIASPIIPLTNVPLEDVAGYDDHVFFQMVDGLTRRDLKAFKQLSYHFDQQRVAWADTARVSGRIDAPTIALSLQNQGILGETLHPAIADGNGFFVAEDGNEQLLQVLGDDYTLPNNGLPGLVQFAENINKQVTQGATGSFVAASVTFTDNRASFLTEGILPGYRLKILGGDSQGSYIVASVVSETVLTVEASVPFSTTESIVPWELYESFLPTVYDPGVVADVQYEPFNHLVQEPFTIKVLSGLGPIPSSTLAQSANRLVAVVTHALETGRDIAVRSGIDGTTSTLQLLQTMELGQIQNNALSVPNPLDDHFVGNNFSIVVGSKTYVNGTDLIGVVSFTPSLTGDVIEYIATGNPGAGDLKFGDVVLSNFENAFVHYQEEFLDPSDLAVGVVELSGNAGELNFSIGEMLLNGGDEAYFVEFLANTDVSLSPMAGSFFFNLPLREGQIVEVTYFRADVGGSQLLDEAGVPIQITERLPLFVRQETAIPVDSFTYSFNPAGRTVFSNLTPTVWVGAVRQNYGNSTTVTFDYVLGEIRFSAPVDPAATVLISYAVLEAVGGEQAYTVSSAPVWRPPFYIEKGATSFELEGDRTSDLIPGKLLRLGATPLYIKSASYASGTTTVEIFPSPLTEIGSRAPGHDAVCVLTNAPVTTSVDSVPTTAAAGFMLSVAAMFDPMDKGMTEFVFFGDLTAYTIPGHLLEIEGLPFLIVGSLLSEDGLRTTVHVANPATQGFAFGTSPVKISVRPIYPPNSRQFLGLGAIVPEAEYEVVLYGETTSGGDALPGRSLIRGVEYSLNEQTGALQLLEPIQQGLKASQKLTASFTRLRKLSPFLQDGIVNYPRFSAQYTHVATPDDINGYLGATVVATYTFSSPDSFYTRAVPLREYMGEVARIAAAGIAAQQPHGGPVVTSSISQKNYEQGNFSLANERMDLLDRDRASRAFISVYNEAIVAFEQVLETTSGLVIGDRDGKFRFFIGRDRNYPPPGYEDTITGRLNSRNVWAEVFESVAEFKLDTSDPIINPEKASQDLVTYEVEGPTLNAGDLREYLKEQKRRIKNDIDDIVLVGRRRPHRRRSLGDYRRMGSAHAFSRLFPEHTLAFSTTYPGLLADEETGDPGVYSYLKMVEPPDIIRGEEPVFGSTYGEPIASLSNPVHEVLENITDIQVLDRLPRARIWAYSETGFPEIDSSTDGKVCVIATPLFLKDFPIDPDTGLPDLSQLAANGGSLPDLTTGDEDLSIPPFILTFPPPTNITNVVVYNKADRILPQVAFGKPSGVTYSVGYKPTILSPSGIFNFAGITDAYKGVFVHSIVKGCIIVFTDGGSGASEITNSDDLIRIGKDGEPLPFSLEKGDTLYIIPPGSDEAAFANPPTSEQMDELVKNKPHYRNSFDVGIDTRGGALIDRSLPSFADPFPFGFKELLGQNPPKPLSTIQAEVSFVNNNVDPTEIPALVGAPYNDSGDFGIPYIEVSGYTEVDVLSGASSVINTSLTEDGPLPQAVYPDEIIAADGEILGAAVGIAPPAVLMTSVDLTPVTTAGSYTAHSAIGDVKPYDLILVENSGSNGAPVGMQGVLSVATVSTNQLEIPRFVTATKPGDPITYDFQNAFCHLTTTGLSGMVIEEVGPDTIIDISSVGGMVFNDGAGVAATGGLNNIVSYSNANTITIALIDQVTGLIVQTLVLQGNSASGALSTQPLGSVPLFTDTQISVPATGFVDFTLLGSVSPGPTGTFDFVVSVNTVAGGSDTGYVDSDRLTFHECYDLRSLKPRGSLTTGAVNVGASFEVVLVTASGSTTCTVNDATTVNGGVPFTFLIPDTLGSDIGSFIPASFSGAGNENSAVKVPSFEGHGNVPVVASNVKFSAVPSSNEDTLGVICTGTATIASNTSSLRNVSVSTGRVQSGDIVVVGQSSIGDAAVTTGTYLVRHAISLSNTVTGFPDVHEVIASAYAGSSGSQWLPITFPRVNTISFPLSSSGTLVTTAIQSIPSSPSGHSFASTGTLYIVKSPVDLSTSLAVQYSSVIQNPDSTTTFTLIDNTATDSGGSPLANDIFEAAVDEGVLVSGMVYAPIGKFKSSFPDNNVVGKTLFGVVVGFFGTVELSNDALGSTLTPLTPTTGVPALNQIKIQAGTVLAENDYDPNRKTAVYSNVPVHVELNAVDWVTFHGAPVGINAILPGDTFTTKSGTTPGFLAQSGIFLEPSFPTPTSDIGGSSPLVVDAAHDGTLALTSTGIRNPTSFGVVSPESIQFEVRRIRRFHDVLTTTQSYFNRLRYAYEIRRGEVVSYSPSSRFLLAAGEGTQLGSFLDDAVNVHPGDEVRIVNANGEVLDKAEIAMVFSNNILLLSTPGFVISPPTGGESFEIYLRRAPVPHEQSNQQLYEIITEQILLDREANPATPEGGSVDTLNELKDLGVDFQALGVQVGDLIVVDPAGTLEGATGPATTVEYGARPFGDQSVPDRGPGLPYVAGAPSELDDNRGFYRVLEVVNANTLRVNPQTTFSGNIDGGPGDVVFGANTQEYAVLPTVTGSAAPFARALAENQMDLRPTALAGVSSGDPNSYRGNDYSVGPFSYKIIRPNLAFADETIDLVLFMRERLFSWMESLESVLTDQKQGSYHVFQSDLHITNLGSALIPGEGFGVMSNAFLTDLSGLIEVTPFANSSDALSILDRRYWVLDLKLDTLRPPFTSLNPYASFETDNSVGDVYTVGSGRPVLPDLIEDVLDRTDKLRQLRFAWIRYRTNKVGGTLAAVNRFDAELPRRLQEQADLLRIQQTFRGIVED